MSRHHTKERMYGWHLRKGDGLTYGDPRTPAVGARIQAQGLTGRTIKRPRICGPGLHAFPKLDSYTSYINYGKRLSFVLLENVACKKGHNKVSAQYRTILWQGDVPDNVHISGAAAVEKWLAMAGFKRASATAKARVLRQKRRK